MEVIYGRRSVLVSRWSGSPNFESRTPFHGLVTRQPVERRPGFKIRTPYGDVVVWEPRRRERRHGAAWRPGQKSGP